MNQKEYENIRRSLLDSEGYLLIKKMNIFALSFYVFKENYLELVEYIDSQVEIHNEDKWGLFNLNTPMEIIMRLFHNFAASVYSLISATRKFYCDECAPKEKLKDYNIKINEIFIANPVTHMIKDLRTMIQHCLIPPISFSAKDNGSTLRNVRFFWKTEELFSEYTKWSSGAKKYMNNSNGKIDIKIISQEYYNITLSFYQWFNKRLYEDFQDIISETKHLQSKLISLRFEEEATLFLNPSNMEYSPLNMISLSKLIVFPKEKMHMDKLSYIQEVDLILQSFVDQKRIDKTTQKKLHDKYKKYLIEHFR